VSLYTCTSCGGESRSIRIHPTEHLCDQCHDAKLGGDLVRAEFDALTKRIDDSYREMEDAARARAKAEHLGIEKWRPGGHATPTLKAPRLRMEELAAETGPSFEGVEIQGEHGPIKVFSSPEGARRWCLSEGGHTYSSTADDTCSRCGLHGKLVRTLSYVGSDSKASQLADECGRLKTENTDLLAENARLRRALEKAGRK
jgi:hypothetical protein